MKALSPLQQTALAHPHVEALRSGTTKLSYQELAKRSLVIANKLKAKGIRRLGVIGPNSAEQVLLYWSCIEAGVLFCPLSWRFPPSQLTELITRFGIDAIYWHSPDLALNSPEHQAAFADIVQFSLDELTTDEANLGCGINATERDWHAPINLVLTSGSSGIPKAALHSLSNHIASAEGSASLIPLAPNDSWLLSLPLFHIGGIAILNRCAHAGATVVIQEETMAKSLQQQRPSHLSMVSTQLEPLLSTPLLLDSVKALLLGGGAIPASMLARLIDLGITAYCSYGLTEMSSQVTSGAANNEGHSGALLPRRELKIEAGQILLRGDTLFLGYLTPNGIERPLTPDGWFESKDKGRWLECEDEPTRLIVEGRLDNMFICGGENLQPEEVEAALCRHPGIAEAIVFAVNDKQFGNLPHAMIRLSEPAHAMPTYTMPTQAELDEFLAQHLARFKRPRRYYSWPDLQNVGLKSNRKLLIQKLTTEEGLVSTKTK